MNKTYSVLEGRRNTGSALQKSLKITHLDATQKAKGELSSRDNSNPKIQQQLNKVAEISRS